VKRIVLAVILLSLSITALSAQEILTAERYLAQVGERYQAMKDYTAQVTIVSGQATMHARSLYKAPSLMRLDFSVPEGQIIVFNGDTLTVYLPEYRAVMSQTVNTDSSSGGASLASASGLSILRRNYAASYRTSPAPVPLNDPAEGEAVPENAEMVVKLVLSRRSLSEGFREIQLAINPETFLIRRIEGLTIANEQVSFDFVDIKPDQGIADALFTYESQPSANFYDNFLYRDSD